MVVCFFLPSYLVSWCLTMSLCDQRGPVGPVVSGPTKVKGSSLIYWVNVDLGQSHLDSFSRFTYCWLLRPCYLTLGSSLACSSVFHFSPKILTTVIIVIAFIIWVSAVCQICAQSVCDSLAILPTLWSWWWTLHFAEEEAEAQWNLPSLPVGVLCRDTFIILVRTTLIFFFFDLESINYKLLGSKF